MRCTVAIDGLVTSRSTCERKLSVTPARSETSRSVSRRAWRSARIRTPSWSSVVIDVPSADGLQETEV
jgi:hypothetical protein